MLQVDSLSRALALLAVGAGLSGRLALGPAPSVGTRSAGDVSAVGAVLRGQVVDTAGVGIPEVQVVVTELGRTTTTDTAGRYELVDLPAGRFEIVYRRLGYHPLRLMRTFGEGARLVVDVRLVVLPVVLPEVETRAAGPPPVPPKLRDWARRREFNVGGRFWDDSLMRTQEYRKLPEVLQGIPGVRIIRYRGGRYLANARSNAQRFIDPRLASGRRGDDLPPRACYVTIYLDGAPMSTMPLPPSLDDFSVVQIAAMEYYSSTAQIPSELKAGDSTCGVLVIWTR